MKRYNIYRNSIRGLVELFCTCLKSLIQKGVLCMIVKTYKMLIFCRVYMSRVGLASKVGQLCMTPLTRGKIEVGYRTKHKCKIMTSIRGMNT